MIELAWVELAWLGWVDLVGFVGLDFGREEVGFELGWISCFWTKWEETGSKREAKEITCVLVSSG